MSDARVVQLHWPMGGVNERFAYQHQAPYTTTSSLNCRPDSWTVGGRERGGTRPGLAKAFSSQLGSGNPVQMVNTLQYISSNAIQTRILAIANGNLYFESPVGTISTTAVSGGTFHTTKLISSAERNQILYIADHSDTVADSAVSRAPKKYDPSTGLITAWAATSGLGTIPYGSPCLCNWRDRAVLAGGTTSPHGVFLSRQGDFLDWDYSKTDVGAAVSFTLAHAGLMGDAVTCVSPHGDNCLIIGGTTSLWIMRGDPSYGNLHNLSPTHGVIDRGAFCTTPDGLFVFLSQDGIYMVPAGCEAAQHPVSVSREKLPTQMLATDRTTTRVAMAYDLIDRGIHIFLTALTEPATPSTHWFLDWENKSFWKVKLGNTDFEPHAMHARKNWYTTDSGVLLGCRDGYLRYHEHSAEDDDGTDFDSEVWLGPIGDPTMMLETLLSEISAALGTDSGEVQFSIYAGDSPEQAYASDPLYQSNWTFGRNNTEHPRVRGQALYIKLSGSEAGVAWAWESGYAVIGRKGRTRP